jgi:hypothetical protein
MLSQVIDGPKNFRVIVRGITKADFEPTPVLEVSRLGRPDSGWKGIRLDSAVWTIQEKMGLVLWWRKPEMEGDMVFPMESRNAIRFEDGLSSPRFGEGWDGGLYLSGFNVEVGPLPKRFFVLLVFDKQ